MKAQHSAAVRNREELPSQEMRDVARRMSDRQKAHPTGTKTRTKTRTCLTRYADFAYATMRLRWEMGDLWWERFGKDFRRRSAVDTPRNPR